MPEFIPPPSAPVLPGFIEEHAHSVNLRVWCRWCCHWHIHGLNAGDRLVHRVAHCYAPDSAYHSSGYSIQITGTPYREVASTIRAASAPQRRAIGAGRISAAVQQLRGQPAPAGCTEATEEPRLHPEKENF